MPLLSPFFVGRASRALHPSMSNKVLQRKNEYPLVMNGITFHSLYLSFFSIGFLSLSSFLLISFLSSLFLIYYLYSLLTITFSFDCLLTYQILFMVSFVNSIHFLVFLFSIMFSINLKLIIFLPLLTHSKYCCCFE